MTALSKRFFAHVRQYAALEQRFNRDYSDQITLVAAAEVAALVNNGMTEADARAAVNRALQTEVKRFPVQLQTTS